MKLVLSRMIKALASAVRIFPICRNRASIHTCYALSAYDTVSRCERDLDPYDEGGITMGEVYGGGFTSTGAILVLFILLVIISRALVL